MKEYVSNKNTVILAIIFVASCSSDYSSNSSTSEVEREDVEVFDISDDVDSDDVDSDDVDSDDVGNIDDVDECSTNEECVALYENESRIQNIDMFICREDNSGAMRCSECLDDSDCEVGICTKRRFCEDVILDNNSMPSGDCMSDEDCLELHSGDPRIENFDNLRCKEGDGFRYCSECDSNEDCPSEFCDDGRYCL